jgi:homoserine/homoserine lactone efflux protein
VSLPLWLGFLLAAILIAVTPGPGAVISMSTGIRHGYRAALTVILGLQVALALHVAIVALGLGALLAASETAFAVLRFIGASYLIWLGIQKWRSPVVPADAAASPVLRNGLFLQGLLVNLTSAPTKMIALGLVRLTSSPCRNNPLRSTGDAAAAGTTGARHFWMPSQTR